MAKEVFTAPGGEDEEVEDVEVLDPDEELPAATQSRKKGSMRSVGRAARDYVFGANIRKGGSKLGHLGADWMTSGLTAVALGFATSMFGPDLAFGGMRIPLDLTLGITTGLVGVQIRNGAMQVASSYMIGAAAGRLAHEWFHGPPVSDAVARMPGPLGHGALHASYGFGSNDPLVLAARYL